MPVLLPSGKNTSEKSLVVGRYQPWLTAADAYVARYPTKLAFCSRFRRQRETPYCSDFSL
jgi:hypothetical protein